MKKSICLLAALFSLSPVAAISAENHGDWISKKEDGRCTAWTLPQMSQGGNGKGRYVSIVNVPEEGVKNSVALVYGKSGAGKTHASASVDGQTFELLTFNTAAFAASGKPEAALIKAMRGGSEIEVNWTENDGSIYRDTYSLIGFTAAKNKIDADCR